MEVSGWVKRGQNLVHSKNGNIAKGKDEDRGHKGDNQSHFEIAH